MTDTYLIPRQKAGLWKIIDSQDECPYDRRPRSEGPFVYNVTNKDGAPIIEIRAEMERQLSLIRREGGEYRYLGDDRWEWSIGVLCAGTMSIVKAH